jgi:hypothetical protein
MYIYRHARRKILSTPTIHLSLPSLTSLLLIFFHTPLHTFTYNYTTLSLCLFNPWQVVLTNRHIPLVSLPSAQAILPPRPHSTFSSFTLKRLNSLVSLLLRLPTITNHADDTASWARPIAMSQDPTPSVFRRQSYKPKPRPGLPRSYTSSIAIESTTLTSNPSTPTVDSEEIDVILSSPSMIKPTSRREVVEVNVPVARWRSRDRKSATAPGRFTADKQMRLKLRPQSKKQRSRMARMIMLSVEVVGHSRFGRIEADE